MRACVCMSLRTCTQSGCLEQAYYTHQGCSISVLLRPLKYQLRNTDVIRDAYAAQSALLDRRHTPGVCFFGLTLTNVQTSREASEPTQEVIRCQTLCAVHLLNASINQAKFLYTETQHTNKSLVFNPADNRLIFIVIHTRLLCSPAKPFSAVKERRVLVSQPLLLEKH